MKAILLDLVNLVNNENKGLFVNICLCYDIINCILKTALESGIELSYIDQDLLNTNLKMRLDSVDNLVDIIQHLEKTLCARLITRANPDESCFEAKVKRIIQNSFSDSEFSVQSIADKMGLSLPTLSRKFKNVTGKNILDYIISTRLEKAKDLLISTDKSVMEITSSVGYLSSNSFIIKFKQMTGMTPGEFRNAYKRRE